VSANYILRLRQLLETVRKLQGTEGSSDVERQLAELEHELQQAATDMTIQACRQEVERRGHPDRRLSRVPVALERRLTPSRRSTDGSAGGAPDL
jgi:hypothetical protein